MKILIIGLNFSPEEVGVGKYTADLARYLVGQGHVVRVISGVPYYPHWSIRAGWPSWRYSFRPIDVPNSEAGNPDSYVVHCPIYVPSRPTGLRRVAHLVSFAVTSAPPALLQAFWRPNRVLAIAPTLCSSVGALACGLLARAPTVLHVQDLEIDAAYQLNLLRHNWLKAMVLWAERQLLRRFRIISTISTGMAEQLLGKGLEPERIVLFPNGVDTTAIFPMSTPSSLRAELAIPDGRCVALYSGTMGRKQGLETIADVVCDPRLRDIEFVFCGDGPAREELVQALKDRPNVRFLPLHPIDRLNDLLNLADIHLLPQRSGISSLVLPSKLTGMLASGRPIVAWSDKGTPLADLISTCGVAVPPGDSTALASALLSLANNADERQTLGRAGREKALMDLNIDRLHERFESAVVGLAR